MDYSVLRSEANGIKNEVEVGGITAERVGNVLLNLVNNSENIDKRAQSNSISLGEEVTKRSVAYIGDLGSFVGLSATKFVSELMLKINALGGNYGRYSFTVGGGGAGTKQFVVYGNVGSKKKLIITGCLKAETLNGTGSIDTSTSTFTTVVECDISVRSWCYVTTRINDLYYEDLEDDYSFDESADWRSCEVFSREQMLGILSHLKQKILNEVKAMINNN